MQTVLKNHKKILKIIAVSAAVIAVVALIITRIHLWPIYLIIAAWLITLKKREQEVVIAAVLATTIFLVITWLWSTGIAVGLAPAGQKLAAFKNWAGSPVTSVWAMLSGAGPLPGAAEVRSAWAPHQAWFIPLLYVLTYALSYRARAQREEKATLHGSAQFGDPVKVGLTGHREGFILGREKGGLKKEVVLPLKEVNEHVLINGAPGAGKSASIYITNLLRVARNGAYANLVVTDPKTELLSVCGPVLKEAGYEVHVYHPYAPELSDAWNMLYYARDFERIDDMVLTIINNTSGKIDYWDQQTNMLFDLIAAHLRMALGEHATMNHVQALAGAASPADIEVTLKNSPDQKVRANATGFFSRIKENEKIISSIMSDLPRRLKLWTIDTIRATTSKNEIDFSELCTDKKVALFVVTPMDKKEQLKPLFATFFTQLFKEVQEKGRELGKLPRPLWFMLDEFANLGTIPNFDNFLTVVRGYNVGVILGIQSRSQLNELYGDDRAKTIIESCSTYIIFPHIGLEDAKYYSQMLGRTTRLTMNRRYPRHPLRIRFDYHEGESAVGRPLMDADEIRALDKHRDLLVVAGTRRPVHIDQALYFKDRRWKKLGEECRSEEVQKRRRAEFNRSALGKEPLEVPGEEKMMEEAAMLAVSVAGVRKKEQAKKGQKQESERGQGTPPEIKRAYCDLRRHRERMARRRERKEQEEKAAAEDQGPEIKVSIRREKQAKVLRVDDGNLFGEKK